MLAHSPFCLFVPPHILENLAKSGNEDARASVQASIAFEQERVAQSSPLLALQGLTETGNESRLIYDCQNSWQLEKQKARFEGEPVSPDEAVNDAYDSTGYTRDHYRTTLQRHSIDNRSSDIISNIHYGVKFMNAGWNGKEMIFGDGDGVIFVNFAKSIGVVAHELSHGVIQNTAQLIYDKQPGALNEHFADVFGCVVEQRIKGETADDADWLIGDEIMGPTLYGEALRSMKAPGTAYDNSLLGKDPQPAHMRDYYTGDGDHHGVHINSGIPNRAFYLVAMDIGTEKAALIWYTGLQRLWATAQFTDAVTVLVQAARDLIKEGQVSPGSAQAIRSAFKEVGIL